MLETSHQIIHKMTLIILRHPDSDSEIDIADLVKGILCEQLTKCLNLSLPWYLFSKGGSITTNDNSANGRIASVTLENESLWALTLKLKDPVYNRRRWIYYIGLRHQEDAVRLYYAKCCYDHLAGSFYPAKPIPAIRDSLIDPLLFNKHVQCMSGKYPLLTEASLLAHSTLPSFINYLQDEKRYLPIVLITCPWRIHPEPVQDQMLGNALVYWCEDSSVIMRMNTVVSENLYTPWNSVRVFVPIHCANAYHPLFSCEDIIAMGEDNFVEGLKQAYCQSLLAEDVRNFVTIDDVFRCRNKQQYTTLVKKTQSQEEKIASLQHQYDELKASNSIATAKLAEFEKKPDLSEYESLLNDLMKESESLKSGLSDLVSQLYSCAGSPASIETAQNPHLQELLHAIQTCFSHATRK